MKQEQYTPMVHETFPDSERTPVGGFSLPARDASRKVRSGVLDRVLAPFKGKGGRNIIAAGVLASTFLGNPEGRVDQVTDSVAGIRDRVAESISPTPEVLLEVERLATEALNGTPRQQEEFAQRAVRILEAEGQTVPEKLIHTDASFFNDDGELAVGDTEYEILHASTPDPNGKSDNHLIGLRQKDSDGALGNDRVLLAATANLLSKRDEYGRGRAIAMMDAIERIHETAKMAQTEDGTDSDGRLARGE